MRKLWIALAVVTALVVAAVVAGVLSLNRIIAANQERILAQAQAALGRKVDVSSIGVSVWPGIGVRLADVRIAEDPQFGPDDFFQAPALTAHAQWRPLFAGRFEISHLTATRPRVRLVRDTSGEWNFMRLRAVASRRAAVPDAGLIGLVATSHNLRGSEPGDFRLHTARLAQAAVPAPAASALPFLLGELRIAGGTVIVIDRSRSPVHTTPVTDIDATVRLTTLQAPVEVRVAAALAAEQRNIDVHGTVGPLGNSGLPIQLAGVLGPFGPAKTRVDALHVTAQWTPARLRITQLTGELFGGTVALSADYSLQSGAMLAVEGKGTNLAVARAIDAAHTGRPAPVHGQADVTLDLRARGTTQDAMLASVNGTAAVDVREGRLTDFNLAREVVTHTAQIPIAGPQLAAQLSTVFGRRLDGDDTPFERLHGTVALGGQQARPEDLTFTTADYDVTARGSVGFDGATDLACLLRLSPQFSGEITAKVREAKLLADPGGRVALPFRLRGSIDRLEVDVDRDDITAILQRGVRQGGAKELLGLLLRSQPPPTPGATPGLAERLDKGLRGLLGR